MSELNPGLYSEDDVTLPKMSEYLTSERMAKELDTYLAELEAVGHVAFEASNIIGYMKVYERIQVIAAYQRLLSN